MTSSTRSILGRACPRPRSAVRTESPGAPQAFRVVPAAFTETTGRAHWEALIRARAIGNLAYVLAPAPGGYHLSGRETHGHSMVVDPWGTVLDRLPCGSGVVVAGVNPTYQARLRKSLPALTDKTIRTL